MLNLLYGLAHFRKVGNLKKKFVHFYSVAGKFRKFKHFLSTAAFYRVYRKRFSDDILFSANYITQSERVGHGTKYITEEDKLKLAGDLVQTYADARLVITSRIHCALPCLAVGTPSIFIHTNGVGHVRDPGRFDGLLDLFNVITFEASDLVTTDCNTPSHVTLENMHNIQNNGKHVKLASEMVRRCKDFFHPTNQELTKDKT